MIPTPTGSAEASRLLSHLDLVHDALSSIGLCNSQDQGVLSIAVDGTGYKDGTIACFDLHVGIGEVRFRTEMFLDLLFNLRAGQGLPAEPFGHHRNREVEAPSSIAASSKAELALIETSGDGDWACYSCRFIRHSALPMVQCARSHPSTQLSVRTSRKRRCSRCHMQSK